MDSRAVDRAGLVSLALASLLGLVAVSPFPAALVSPAVGRVDELMTGMAIALFLLVALALGRVRVGFMAIGAWVGTLWFLSALFGRSNSLFDVALQGLLQAKFFLFSACTLSFVRPGHARTVLVVLAYVLLAGALANAVAPEVFYQLGAKEHFRDSVFGLPRLSGFQLNPNRLGRTLALIALLPLGALRLTRGHERALLVAAAAVVYLTGSRTGLALFGLGVAIRIVLSVNDARLRRWVAVATLVPVTIAIGAFGVSAARLSNLGAGAVVGEEAPVFRAVLLLEGVRLSIKHFPFGSGLATFGTPFAMNSDVYRETAISSTFFFNKDTALFDSNLGSILGETGIVGLLWVVGLFGMIVWRALARSEMLTRAGVLAYFVVLLNFEALMQNAVTSSVFALFLCVLADSSGSWDRLSGRRTGIHTAVGS